MEELQRRQSRRTRLLWVALAVVVGCAVGAGLYKLVEVVREPSEEAVEARGATGVQKPSEAWLHAADRPQGWTKLSPPGSTPDARQGHSMAYLPLGGWVLLFGGRGSDGLLGDTWAYDVMSNTWTRLSFSTGPPAREGQSMAFAVLTTEVVLFGGQGDDGLLGDTWTYDPLRDGWHVGTQSGSQSEPAPSPRRNSALAFDPLVGRLILFGGESADGLMGDTWVYDPVRYSWTEVHPAGDLPCPRQGQSMIFDPTSGAVIMYGGATDAGVLGDVWTFDPVRSSWTQLHPASPGPPRYSFALACRSTTGRVTLFGGAGAGEEVQAQTWSYDLNSSWVMNESGESGPGAREAASMVYCDLPDTMILFGGLDAQGIPLSDTWAYWTEPIWW